MEFDFVKALTSTAGSSQAWFKVVILVVFAPIWFPILKVMLAEVEEVLAPQGGLFANKKPRPSRRPEPGLDPFLNIPRATHRRRLQQRTPAARRNTGSQRSTATASRRTGF